MTIRSTHPAYQRHARIHGFTLIELLTALALLGLLGSLAYPAYLKHVQRGQRAQAQAALHEQLLQQEQYYRQHGRYAHFAAGNASSAPFRQRPAGAASPYSLGARACGHNGQQRLDDNCVEAFARAGTHAALPELALDSLGGQRCTHASGAPCTQ